MDTLEIKPQILLASAPTISWERLLAEKHKVFFASYIHLQKGSVNEFYYQNGGKVAEEVVAVFFHADGRRVAEVPQAATLLAPSQALVIDATSAFAQAGYASFQGSVMVVVHPTAVVEGDDITQRDFVCYWSSGPSGHSVHIGMGGLKEQNVVGKKETKTYNMFCPTIISNETRKTRIVILNHSSDPNYSDEVTIVPVLSNLNGEKVKGRPLIAKAFGAFFVDVDEVFGDAGQKLLKKTGGRGTVTALHKGQTFITLFFHIDTQTNELVSGTHTTPAASIPYSYAIERPWINAWAEKTPIFYVLWRLKHFRSSPWFVNLYPPRPLFANSIFSYLAQSRWILQLTYLLRFVYFFARRGFRMEVLQSRPDAHLNDVIHNQLWDAFNMLHFARARIEMLVTLLKLAPAKLNGKTLSIGPRNEGELLLFWANGFTDVVGIDLFSYSPHIKVMDAHAMTFADNTFDTINCGWVLTYTYDMSKVIREIVRTAKSGAIVACAYTMPAIGDGALGNGTDKSRSAIHADKILALFGPNAGHVYWRDDANFKPGSKHHLVFEIVK